MHSNTSSFRSGCCWCEQLRTGGIESKASIDVDSQEYTCMCGWMRHGNTHLCIQTSELARMLAESLHQPQENSCMLVTRASREGDASSTVSVQPRDSSIIQCHAKQVGMHGMRRLSRRCGVSSRENSNGTCPNHINWCERRASKPKSTAKQGALRRGLACARGNAMQSTE